MAFHLIHGNDSDALLDALAERLRMPQAAVSPLAPEIVLVPQFGLRRWLEIRLAEKLGIVANVEFYAPAEYAWRLLRAADPMLAQKSGYERELLRWRIFSLLPALAREPRHGELATALGDGDASLRLRFADALAHAYERDLAYRSERLARWERGAEPGEWRAELWCRLVATSAQPHRARALADWIARRAPASAVPPGVPTRLFAFACTNISPDLLGFYGRLAQHCRIDFYLPTPCRAYWGDVRSSREQLRAGEEFDSDAFVDDENPALAAWSRAGRDLIDRIYSYEYVQPEEENDASRAPCGDSLLARVQSDVLDRRAPVRAKAGDDGSIQFHRCHSRLREVQALHDRLLDLFARDPTLTPRDVAVMSPEIGAYAAHIESVFGGIARDDARHLPYALSDCPVRETHPLVGVALRLIALPTSRLELAEIGEWLALPGLQRRFGLDPGDATRLVGWLREAGVRWGLDAAQHAAAGAGDYAEFSWRFGLERLLLGYASGEADLIDGIAPDAAVEGSDADVLGAVLRIIDVLDALRRAQRGGHVPYRWQKLYNDTFAQLFDADDDRDAAQALERVRGALADFADEAALAGMNDEIDWRCVRDELAARLAEPERAFRFFGGGITVCGMVPLRAVPFRVICLIGMNENAFPRRDRASPFERAGDRRVEPSIRDEDHFLFLQQLMAARDEFHLSWVGENVRDGSREEPSAVVAELLDVLAQYGLEEKGLVVEHPLQPFSPRLFDGQDKRLFTYDSAWLRAPAQSPAAPVRSIDGVGAAPVAIAPPRLDWRDWQRFWRNPAAAYFKTALGIELTRAPAAEDEADDLVLSRLGEYRVFEALFDAQENSDPATQRDRLRASAALPVGMAGDRAFSELQAPLAALAAKRDERGGARPSVLPAPFDLDLGALSLSGLLPAHRDGLLVRALPGEANGHRLLQAWLDFLLLATQRDDARLMMLEWKNDAPLVRETHAVAPAQARAWLGDLALLHARGAVAALPFFPKASYAWAQRRSTRERGDSDETEWTLAAFKVAKTVFATDERHRGEDADAAFALAARDIAPFDPATREGRDFADCAQRVFAPLLATLQPQAADSVAATTTSKPRAKPGKAK